MKLKTKIGIGIIIALLIGLSTFYFAWKSEKKERIRQESNVEQLTKNVDQANMNLNLTHKEFAKAKTDWKVELDSVMKANDIALKSVKSATIIKTEYKDTGSVKIVYKKVTKPINSAIYTIPVSYSDSCWGIRAKILSKDPETKINITERTASNSSQLLILRKRLWGFLWYQNKKTEYKGFTKCGEMKFTQIQFVKK